MASHSSASTHFLEEIRTMDSGRYTVDTANDDYVLGEGTYGCVIKATDSRYGREVAIKRQQPSKELRRLVWEVLLLKHFDHINILRLYSLHLDVLSDHFEKCYIIGETMDTSLQWVIFDSPQALGEEHLKLLFYQMLLGIYHMHTSEVMHRDLKPANVLLDSQCNVRLCDFGLSRKMGDRLSDYVVTRWYRAPELVAGLSYSYPVDIWSIGVMLAELIMRKPLFPITSARDGCGRLSGHLRGKQMLQILQKIGTPTAEDVEAVTAPNVRAFLGKTNLPDTLLQVIDDNAKVPVTNDLKAIIREMLQFNPKKRPTAENLLKRPYFEEHFSLEEFQRSLGNPLPEKWRVTFDTSEADLRSLLLEEVMDFRVKENQLYEAWKAAGCPADRIPGMPQTSSCATTPVEEEEGGMGACPSFDASVVGSPMRCNSENVALENVKSGVGWPDGDDGAYIDDDDNHTMEEDYDDDEMWELDEEEEDEEEQ
eukprot:TRINITY_DN22139_c0_g1_i1.p1 TRINITY_DN22139_c0_g1~~TRINITY_DN22139_c0_g1_i1.p1  ORF type:complete len:481 (+),score=45.64 TRINITY_DN22139_c0_g1_i1:92-1534(+)